MYYENPDGPNAGDRFLALQNSYTLCSDYDGGDLEETEDVIIDTSMLENKEK